MDAISGEVGPSAHWSMIGAGDDALGGPYIEMSDGAGNGVHEQPMLARMSAGEDYLPEPDGLPPLPTSGAASTADDEGRGHRAESKARSSKGLDHQVVLAASTGQEACGTQSGTCLSGSDGDQQQNRNCTGSRASSDHRSRFRDAKLPYSSDMLAHTLVKPPLSAELVDMTDSPDIRAVWAAGPRNSMSRMFQELPRVLSSVERGHRGSLRGRVGSRDVGQDSHQRMRRSSVTSQPTDDEHQTNDIVSEALDLMASPPRPAKQALGVGMILPFPRRSDADPAISASVFALHSATSHANSGLGRAHGIRGILEPSGTLGYGKGLVAAAIEGGTLSRDRAHGLHGNADGIDVDEQEDEEDDDDDVNDGGSDGFNRRGRGGLLNAGRRRVLEGLRGHSGSVAAGLVLGASVLSPPRPGSGRPLTDPVSSTVAVPDLTGLVGLAAYGRGAGSGGGNEASPFMLSRATSTERAAALLAAVSRSPHGHRHTTQGWGKATPPGSTDEGRDGMRALGPHGRAAAAVTPPTLPVSKRGGGGRGPGKGGRMQAAEAATLAALSMPVPQSAATPLVGAGALSEAGEAGGGGLGTRCACKKSKCLKLYCDCFALQRGCSNTCSCLDCKNNDAHATLRDATVRGILAKKPDAFRSKLDASRRGHRKGCNCSRSACLKKYCECFAMGVICTGVCACVGCLNKEESDERSAAMHRYHSPSGDKIGLSPGAAARRAAGTRQSARQRAANSITAVSASPALPSCAGSTRPDASAAPRRGQATDTASEATPSAGGAARASSGAAMAGAEAPVVARAGLSLEQRLDLLGDLQRRLAAHGGLEVLRQRAAQEGDTGTAALGLIRQIAADCIVSAPQGIAPDEAQQAVLDALSHAATGVRQQAALQQVAGRAPKLVRQASLPAAEAESGSSAGGGKAVAKKPTKRHRASAASKGATGGRLVSKSADSPSSRGVKRPARAKQNKRK